MSHTTYVTRIILRPLSALFGSQFMLPMETSVTFIGVCANEIIRRNNSGFFNKGKDNSNNTAPSIGTIAGPAGA
jgi:hypothetical protein